MTDSGAVYVIEGKGNRAFLGSMYVQQGDYFFFRPNYELTNGQRMLICAYRESAATDRLDPARPCPKNWIMAE